MADVSFPRLLLRKVSSGDYSQLTPLKSFVDSDEECVYDPEVYKLIYTAMLNILMKEGEGQKKGVFKTKKQPSPFGILAIKIAVRIQSLFQDTGLHRIIRRFSLDQIKGMNLDVYFNADSERYIVCLFVEYVADAYRNSPISLGLSEKSVSRMNQIMGRVGDLPGDNPLAVLSSVQSSFKEEPLECFPGTTFNCRDFSRRREVYQRMPNNSPSYSFFNNPNFTDGGKTVAGIIMPSFIAPDPPSPIAEFASRFGTNCIMKAPTTQSLSSTDDAIHTVLRFLLESNFKGANHWNYCVEEKEYLEFLKKSVLFVLSSVCFTTISESGEEWEKDAWGSLVELKALPDVVDVQCTRGTLFLLTFQSLVYTVRLSSRTFAKSPKLCQAKLKEYRKNFKDDSATIRFIAGCNDNAVIASNTDSVCIWGSNNCGQCLRPPTDKSVSAVLRTGRIPVHDVAIGNGFIVAVHEDGSILSWGLADMVGGSPPADKLQNCVHEGKLRLCLPKVFNHSKSKYLQGYKIEKAFAGSTHVLCVTTEGKLVAWGDGTNGKLGDGSEDFERYPKQISFFDKIPLVSAACGLEHSLVLTRDGKVYGFGRSSTNELGVYAEKILTPFLIKFHRRAVAVCCAGQSSLVLLSDGDLMAAGLYGMSGSNGGEGNGFGGFQHVLPNYVTFSIRGTLRTAVVRGLPREIYTNFFGSLSRFNTEVFSPVINRPKKIVSGEGYFLVLTETNSLYLVTSEGERWVGDGALSQSMSVYRDGNALESEGERVSESRRTSTAPIERSVLGESDPLELSSSLVGLNSTAPKKIKISHFDKKRIANIYSGPDYVFVLTFDDELYGWGENHHLLLDYSEETFFPHPRLLSLPPETHPIRQIACGGSFVLLLTPKGLFSKGNVDCCGLGDKVEGVVPTAYGECIPEFTLIPTLSLHVITAAAGEQHAVALCRNGVYTWGNILCNSNGIITHRTPIQLQINVPIASVGCGPVNSYLITSTKNLYVWGDNTYNQCGIEGTGESVPRWVSQPRAVAENVRAFAITRNMGVLLTHDGELLLSGEGTFQNSKSPNSYFGIPVRFEFDDKLVVDVTRNCEDDGVSMEDPKTNSVKGSSESEKSTKPFFGVDLFGGWEVIHFCVERNRYDPSK